MLPIWLSGFLCAWQSCYVRLFAFYLLSRFTNLVFGFSYAPTPCLLLHLIQPSFITVCIARYSTRDLLFFIINNVSSLLSPQRGTYERGGLIDFLKFSIAKYILFENKGYYSYCLVYTLLAHSRTNKNKKIV